MLNILVLHHLGSPEGTPSFLRNHVFSLKNYYPEHNYLYHDVGLPLPDYVRYAGFDAVILDVTLLCCRWAGDERFSKIREEYAFVRDLDAVKIAFPQDEYDCSAILDDWLCDWNIDVVYSVIASNWDVLYPKFSAQGKIRLGYTGYIEDSLIDVAWKPFDKRPIDIGYRVNKLPPYFGKTGYTKWKIGELVDEQASRYNLNTDIKLGEDYFLSGRDWYDFIGDCKCVLGANSGSSLLDPYGHIARLFREYVKKNPAASFEEVEEACFAGQDGKYAFTAISPRNLEAALLGSCQILVEGEYSHILKAGIHYLPLKEDASNFSEVYMAMQDRDYISTVIHSCREELLSRDELRASKAAGIVLDEIRRLSAKRHVVSDSDKVKSIIARYQNEMVPRYQSLWKRERLIRNVAKALGKYPTIYRLGKRLKTLAMG